jgi:hypothetical protein
MADDWLPWDELDCRALRKRLVLSQHLAADRACVDKDEETTD